MPAAGLIVQLQPIRPPGRVDRKAAVYASEIIRLRRDGYTYEAIREALLAVGIQLTTSTLRREVQRPRTALRTVARDSGPTAAFARATSPVPTQPVHEAPAPSSASGREVAEAFFTSHPSNSLLRLQVTL